VLNVFASHPLLALFFVTEQKYTTRAAMESTALPQLIE
jgi:hypothetical protein